MNCLVISNIVAYYIITFIAAAKYFYQERSVFICYYPKFSIIDAKCRVEKLYSFSVSFLPTASFLDTIISIWSETARRGTGEEGLKLWSLKKSRLVTTHVNKHKSIIRGFHGFYCVFEVFANYLLVFAVQTSWRSFEKILPFNFSGY